MYKKNLASIQPSNQSQSISSPQSTYFSFQHKPILHQKPSPVCSQLLHCQLVQQKTKLQIQLQNQILCLQQTQQILQKNVYQIIPCQTIAQVIKDIGRMYVQINQKIKKNNQKQIEIGNKQQTIIRILGNIQLKKQKIRKFNNNLFIHLKQISSIQNLLIFAQKQNIRKIVEQHIQQYVHNMVYNTQHCYHNNNNNNNNHHNTSSRNPKNKCLPKCSYNQLLQFIHQFKNQNIQRKIIQLWNKIQKQINKQISQFNRLYGQQIHQNNNGEIVNKQQINSQQQISKIKTQIMNIKVDLQILKNQSKDIYTRIGLQQSDYDNVYSKQWLDSQYFIQLIIHTMNNNHKNNNNNNNPRNYQYSNYQQQQQQQYQQQQQQQQQYNYQQNEHKIQQLKYSFLQYINQLNKQYIKQNKILNNPYHILYQQSCKLLYKALYIQIQNLYNKNYLINQVSNLQNKINQLQILIYKKKQKQNNKNNKNDNDHDNISRIKSRNKFSVDNNNNTQQMLASHVEMLLQQRYGNNSKIQQKQQNKQISVKKMLSIGCMQFRINKTMHISNSVGIQPLRILTSGCNSRISVASTSRSLSRISLKSQARTSSRITNTQTNNRIKCEQCTQRILQFYKKKLILRKQNPHFHEQIQIKRITSIKIINNKQINIYFKKGFINIEFIGLYTHNKQIQSSYNNNNDKSRSRSRSKININKNDNNNNNNNYNNQEQNGNSYRQINDRNLVKIWLKCFKAIYYDIIEGIQFIDSNSNSNNQQIYKQYQQQSQYCKSSRQACLAQSNFVLKQEQQQNQNIQIQQIQQIKMKQNLYGNLNKENMHENNMIKANSKGIKNYKNKILKENYKMQDKQNCSQIAQLNTKIRSMIKRY